MKKNREIFRRLLITFGVLSVFFLGSYFTLRGTITVAAGNDFLVGLLNLASGSSISRMGWFALGVSPYITASILVQMFSKGLIPPLQKLSKQGEVGKQKINQIIKVLTLVFAFMHSYFIVYNTTYSLSLGVIIPASHSVFIMIALMTGSLVVSYLGDLINDYGVGNGQTMIVAFGILMQIPFALYNLFLLMVNPVEQANLWKYIVYLIAIIILVILIIISSKKEWKFQIQSKTIGTQMKAHYLPIKLLASSVMPIILTSSLLALIQGFSVVFKFNASWLNYNLSKKGLLVFGLSIYLFTYLYNFIQMDGSEIQKSLNESGSYVIGVNETKTESFIDKKVFKISHLGAPVLTLIATLLIIVSILLGLNIPMMITGSGILIVVGALFDLTHQIKGLQLKNKDIRILVRKGVESNEN